MAYPAICTLHAVQSSEKWEIHTVSIRRGGSLDVCGLLNAGSHTYLTKSTAPLAVGAVALALAGGSLGCRAYWYFASSGLRLAPLRWRRVQVLAYTVGRGVTDQEVGSSTRPCPYTSTPKPRDKEPHPKRRDSDQNSNSTRAAGGRQVRGAHT